MHYIYISGAIPDGLNDALGWSVAGNKFSINMARAIDGLTGGSLSFISTAALPESIDASVLEIWQGKPLLIAKRGKRFLFSELKLRRSIKKLLRHISTDHKGEEIAVIIENSPFAAATASSTLKKRLGLRLYSITIDTPFTRAFSASSIAGKINKTLFNLGNRALKKFDGIISFTEDVKEDLRIDIPFCPFLIGMEEKDIPEKLMPINAGHNAVYAGTLIYYNGIKELVGAYSMLGEDYKLDIYGYGPLEDFVKESAEKYPNISFKGRFSPGDTKQILSKYDLLINPRLIDSSIENYTFPSKLIDYMLSGKSVISSAFKTLPDEYKEFIYIFEDMTPEKMASDIRILYSDTLEARQKKATVAVEYLKKHQTYKKQAEKILEFIKK